MALGIEDKRGTPGRKIYPNKKTPEKFSGLGLTEKLQAIAGRVRTTERYSRIRQNSVHYLMALYYQGYQNIDLAPGGGAFDVYEREDFYIENQFRRHVDAVVNGLSKNEGDIVIRPMSSSTQDLVKARAAGPVLEMQKQTIGYDRLKDLKNLYKALFGTAFIFTDYIRSKKYGSIVTPKYSYEEIPDPEGGEPFLSKVPAGTTHIFKGREVGAVCSPLEIRCPRDIKSFDDLPYIQWVSRQEVDLLNYLYPGLGAGAGSAIDDDLSQQYLETLANLSGNIFGDQAYSNANTEAQKAELVRTWLMPCMYAGDRELLNKFPDGVHVTTIGGTVVDYYAENLFDRWTYEVLIPTPHSLMGDGLYDALLMQDQINEVNSLLIQHMRYSTIGHKIYDGQMIDIKDVINDPKNGWIRANTSLDKSVEHAVKELRPGQLSTDLPNWLELVKSAMQDMTSTYDPSIGKGIGANTPYSQSVFLTERAQSRWQGSLNFNRPELIRFHKNLLNIAQKEWIEPKTLAVAANTGAWTFKEFSQIDLAGDVDISLSNTDMAPKGRAEQVQAIQMLAEMAPVVAQLSPKQQLRVEEILGLPPDSNPLSTQISRAYRQIDRIKQGEDIAPLPFADDPMMQLPVFKDFMVSEEGEEIAMTQPEIFTKLYMYQTNLLLQMQGQQSLALPGGPQAGQGPPPQGGPAKNAGPGKQPGGQVGQAPGGPPAQSPAVAPPVSPPAAA